MTDKKAQGQSNSEQPSKRDGETDAAYDQRVRLEAEAAGLTPEEYKDKLNKDAGTV